MADVDDDDELMAMEFLPVPYEGARNIVAPDAQFGRLSFGSYVAAIQCTEGPRRAFYAMVMCANALGVQLPRDLRVLLFENVLRMWPVPVWKTNSSKNALPHNLCLPGAIAFRIAGGTLTPRHMRIVMLNDSRGRKERHVIDFALNDAAVVARLQMTEHWLLASVAASTRKRFQSCVRKDKDNRGWVLSCNHVEKHSQWTTGLSKRKELEPFHLTWGHTTLTINQMIPFDMCMHIMGIVEAVESHRAELMPRLRYYLSDTDNTWRL